MDQLICASLCLTHYWYEVGMLKVYKSTNTSKTKFEDAIPPPLQSRGVVVFIVGFPPTRPSPLNTLELCEEN